MVSITEYVGVFVRELKNKIVKNRLLQKWIFYCSRVLYHRKRPRYLVKRAYLLLRLLYSSFRRFAVLVKNQLKWRFHQAINVIKRNKKRAKDFVINFRNRIIQKINYVVSNIKKLLDEETVFTKDSVITMEMLKNGDPLKVVQYLSKKHRFVALKSIQFLISLYKYASAIERKKLSLWESNDAAEKIIIHFCCWGDSYANKVKLHLLPSLLADNNLPELAKKYNISILIHCDNKTKQMISKAQAFSKINEYARVTFCVFPKLLMKLYNIKSKKVTVVFPQIRYLLLGVCQTHAFKVAIQQGAYLSYLMPDVVLSESFLQEAFSKIQGKKLVLTTTYRTSYQTVQSHLNGYYKNVDSKDVLSISGNKLLELQIAHIHPYEKEKIVSTLTNNFTPSARLLFKNKNGYIFRCFHYHPTIVNCAQIQRSINLDYLPIDNTALTEVLDHNLPYEDQTWVCTDPSRMAIMELSDENPETRMVFNTTTLNYSQLVSQVQNLLINAPSTFNSSLNKFLTSFRHQFIVSENINTLADDEIIDDVRFVSDIYKVNGA